MIQGNCYYAQKIISIYPRIYWMEFPTKEKIEHIADTIKAFSDNNTFLVWNLSQSKYDTSFFSSQVADISLSKYSWLSLNYILMTCKAILKWLNSDPSNIAVIHCQSSKRRSSLVIACLLCLLQVFDSPIESLSYFCKKLYIPNEIVFSHSQQSILQNFTSLIHTTQKLNNKKLTIEKIILSEAPAYKSKPLSIIKKHILKPYLQIYDNDSQLLFNSLNQTNNNNSQDMNLYYIPQTEIAEEIIIRCEHYKSEKERVPIFQININPCFISDDVLRLTSNDFDISPEFQVPDNFFIDIIFSSSKEINSNVELLQHLKTECEIQANSYKNMLFPEGTEKKVSENDMKDLDIIGEGETSCRYQKDLMESQDLLSIYPSTVADSRFVIDLDDENFQDYINELNSSL